jgi:HK97 family phage portal protein
MTVKTTGSRLLDAFMGIRRDTEDLDPDDPRSLIRAYSASVWAYRAAKIRAQTLASVPLIVTTNDGEPIDNQNDPIVELFSAGNSSLMYRLELDMVIWGLGYWELSPIKASVQRLNPVTMKIEHSGPRNEISQFIQEIDGNEVARWEPEEMGYFYDFNPMDDFGSVSPLQLALRSAGIDINTTDFIRAYFANDATPGGLLTTDQELTQENMNLVARWWRKTFKGVSKKHSVGIGGFGIKYQQITPDLSNLALPEVREEVRREICAAIGVRESVVGATRAVNFATAKEDHIALYTDTVLPELDLLLDIINHDVIPVYAEDRMVVGNRDAIEILQEDRTEITTRAAQGFEAGHMSLNEVRALEGGEPYDQDYHFIGGKLIPIEMLNDPEEVLELFSAPAPFTDTDAPTDDPSGPQPPDSDEPDVADSAGDAARTVDPYSPPDPPGPKEPAPPAEPRLPIEPRQPRPPRDPWRTAALTELGRWRKKEKSKGPGVEFKRQYIPSGISETLIYDLAVHTPLKDAFTMARVAIRQAEQDEEPIDLLTDIANAPALPDSTVSEEDIEEAVAAWDRDHQGDERHGIIKSVKQVYIWDPVIARYRDAETGTLVSRDTYRAWINEEIERFQKRIGQEINELYSKQQTVEQWEADMRDLLKEAHIQADLLGRGGTETLTPSDRGALGGTLSQQYRFLSRLADTFRAGSFTQVDLNRLRTRAKMYASAIRHTLYRATQSVARAAGAAEKRRVLDPEAEHCPDCEAQAALGWVGIDSEDVTLPTKGVACIVNDRCTMEYRGASK